MTDLPLEHAERIAGALEAVARPDGARLRKAGPGASFAGGFLEAPCARSSATPTPTSSTGSPRSWTSR